LLELADVARQRGDGEAFLFSLRDFHRRLCVYPQFGDPLVDLLEHSGHIRIGIVPPLAMRYGVLEDRRQVFVAALPVLLPHSVTSLRGGPPAGCSFLQFNFSSDKACPVYRKVANVCGMCKPCGL
jgi:hypothetical protein